MATVRSICQQALIEIGAIGAGETMNASDGALAFLRFQHQLNAWAADRLTLSFNLGTSYAWPSGTSTRTIGPGGNINVARPITITQMNYVNPGSSPEVETVIAPMDQDSYAAESIKSLPSALPLAFYYQPNIDDLLGTIFLWPQVTQTITIKIYDPVAVAEPTSLNDQLLAPPGYQEAFLYQLAERLLTPFAIGDQMVTARVERHAATAFSRIKRLNTQPGLLGVDAALIPATGGGYNVYSDSMTGFNR